MSLVAEPMIGAAPSVTGRAGEHTRLPAARTASRMLDPTAVVYIAGHGGLVGSAIWRKLSAAGLTHLVGATHDDLDLRDRAATFTFFKRTRPDVVILAAAESGPPPADNWQRADRLAGNLHIDSNVLDAAREFEVPRLLFIGAPGVYPAGAPQPIPESAILTEEFHPEMREWALAKITGILRVQAVRTAIGLPWISVIPTNLYGPGDNFATGRSHVVAAFIRRYEEACRVGARVVVNRGSGRPRRDFLHVDDMADACLHLLDVYDSADPINIASGVETSIADLAAMVSAEVGYDYETRWDTTVSDGVQRRMLDISALRASGWSAEIDVAEGIADTVEWYRSHTPGLRI